MVVQKLCLKKVRVRIFFQNGFHYVLAQLFYSKGGIDEYQYIVYLNVPTLYGTFLKNDAVFSQKNENKKQKHKLIEIVFAFLFQSCGHATYKMFNHSMGGWHWANMFQTMENFF
jgi:hypothetical protein